MLDVPVFLYQLFYVIFASAIPLLLILFVFRKIVKSGRKLAKSFTN